MLTRGIYFLLNIVLELVQHVVIIQYAILLVKMGGYNEMGFSYNIFYRYSIYYGQEVEKMKWKEYFRRKKEYRERNKNER